LPARPAPAEQAKLQQSAPHGLSIFTLISPVKIFENPRNKGSIHSFDFINAADIHHRSP
jgi:hypothetical protein